MARRHRETREVKLGRLIDGLRVVREGAQADETGWSSRGCSAFPQVGATLPTRKPIAAGGAAVMNLEPSFDRSTVLAIVASIFILVIGAIAYSRLPVAEYPEIAPPAVVIQTQYPGASAQVVADTVATPIEQEVNGVDDMLYMYSQSTSDGNLTITVTFKLGTDLGQGAGPGAQRGPIAEPRLPEEVRRFGVVTKKHSPNLMLVVFPDVARRHLRPALHLQLRAAARARQAAATGWRRRRSMYGVRDYSMRLWLDPDKIAMFGLAAADLLASVRSQNVQVAGGQIAEPPITDRAFQPIVTFLGRLRGRRVREHHRQDPPPTGGWCASRTSPASSWARSATRHRATPTSRPWHGSRPAAGNQRGGHRGEHQGSDGRDGRGSSPRASTTASTTTRPSSSPRSIAKLYKTLLEAIGLVVLVVILFLQTWRATIIPVVAIPCR